MSKKKKNFDETNHSESKGVNKIKIGDIVIMFVLTVLSLTCIIPFIHVAAKSISGKAQVLAQNVFFWPKDITFDAYKAIFSDGTLTHAMVYTIELTLIFTILGMIVCTCAAYPLSKKRLKFRSGISLFLLFSMYFSAGLIPEYLLMKNLGLLNTMWVLILPLIFSPYNTLIMKSFLQSTIPDSLEESAFLDGASNFQILGKIVLPLSKPIIATLSLFYAVGRWNAYADAKYYVFRVRALQPLQYILSNMILSSGQDAISLSEGSMATNTPEVIQAAAIMFATLPILCVYPFVQKYFVKGVMIGAVKG
ncbi:MAG: carbohydrate ABC transporter permease [Lachnospiraceae bacterium]|nr:carbohydrate ABC transporter permease [Lachnospiraceae bacterium]